MESMQYTQGDFELQLRIIRENLADLQKLADRAYGHLGDNVTDEFFLCVKRYCDGVADLILHLSTDADIAQDKRSEKKDENDFLQSDLLL